MTTIDEYYALRPARFGSIATLEFAESEAPPPREPVRSLWIVMVEGRPGLTGNKLNLVFHGVLNLEVAAGRLEHRPLRRDRAVRRVDRPAIR